MCTSGPATSPAWSSRKWKNELIARGGCSRRAILQPRIADRLFLERPAEEQVKGVLAILVVAGGEV